MSSSGNKGLGSPMWMSEPESGARFSEGKINLVLPGFRILFSSAGVFQCLVLPE